MSDPFDSLEEQREQRKTDEDEPSEALHASLLHLFETLQIRHHHRPIRQ